MRRLLAVAALCLLVALAGCADAGIDVDVGVEGPESPDGTPPSTATPDPAASPSTPTGTVDSGGPGSGPEANGSLAAHYLNVGQADATLLVSPAGETMLIDTGPWQDGGETVIEFLEARGIDRIDHLVATHAHADHVGGHAELIDHYETETEGIGTIYDSGVVSTSQTYEDYLDAVDRHDVSLLEVRDGDEIPFAGTDVTVLNPQEPVGDDLHTNGVVLRVAYGETAFLFTGDAERNVEDRLVDDYGDDLDAEVYQAGHHGSDTSSGPEFLDAVDPEVAVISAPYDSQYGHPHDEPLQRFAERDIRTMWTAVHGTTVVESDGTELTVRVQHEATTDPKALREEPKATADPTEQPDERVALGDGAGRLAPVAPDAAGSVPGHAGGAGAVANAGG